MLGNCKFTIRQNSATKNHCQFVGLRVDMIGYALYIFIKVVETRQHTLYIPGLCGSPAHSVKALAYVGIAAKDKLHNRLSRLFTYFLTFKITENEGEPQNLGMYTPYLCMTGYFAIRRRSKT